MVKIGIDIFPAYLIRRFIGSLPILLLSMLFLMEPLNAQVGKSYFPANPANVYNWRSGMINPSIGAFQTSALEAGFKLFHLGFADDNKTAFKSTYALLNLPRLLPAKLAISIHSQLFTSPLFQDMEFSLHLSRQFFGFISLGLSSGFRGLSYQTENFDLVDLDDPVFANGSSRWQPDIGAGATILLTPQIIFGAGVSHLNRPSISLIDNSIRLDPVITVGLAFNFGSVSMHSSANQHQEVIATHSFFQLYDESIGLLQGGYGEQGLLLYGRLRVTGPLSFGYGFNYPVGDLSGNSSGNHEVNILYEFDRLRVLPEIGTPPTYKDRFVPAMPRIDLVPQFYSIANHESVDIFEKELIRDIAEDIGVEKLSKLTVFDIGVLDSSFVESPYPFNLQETTLPDTIIGDSVNYSNQYLASLRKLSEDLQRTPADVSLITPENQKKRAISLKEYLQEALATKEEQINIYRARYLTENDSLTYDTASARMDYRITMEELLQGEELVILKPSKVTFDVHSVAVEDKNISWSLIIENTDDQVIYKYNSSESEEEQVLWNWRDLYGNFIGPGFYRYYIEWIDEWGHTRRSPARVLYARKLKRSIRVQISSKYQDLKPGTNNVGIILNK